jgi:transposase
MIIQKDLHNDSSLKKFFLGAHPIIQSVIEKLHISQIISTYIPYNKNLKIPTDKILCLLIHNFLTKPTPMYEFQDWLLPLDESSLGLSLEEASCVNDDCLGKSLDRFYNGRNKDVFFSLALRAIELYKLDCGQIHQDTTTITFTGKYENPNSQENITHGHNKDHRPDLKQLVLGLSVTADGAVPLVHDIYNGNESDSSVHQSNIKKLRKLLNRSDFIYVADSKLASITNLRAISDFGGLFVSVMPRTWEEDKVFRTRVIAGEIKWKHIFSRPNNREDKRDHYFCPEGDFTSQGGYRLIWIKSTQKAEQDAETRDRHIEKTEDALEAIKIRLNTYQLKSHEKIEQKIKSILKQNNSENLYDYEIHKSILYKVKHKKPGRPGKELEGKSVPYESYSLSYQLNLKKLREEELTDGIFPLITNLPKKSPRDILKIYKSQAFLEKRHSQIKTYQGIAPVFLKKASRVVAYLHMNVMALMVATLIERTLRKKIKELGVEPLPIYPSNQDCPFPTMFDIVRLFDNVERYEVIQDGKTTLFPANLSQKQKQVLEYLGVSVSLYV